MMDAQSTKTGIIYSRVSSLEQVEGTSLETQEKGSVEFADRLKVQVLKTFMDKGESAKTSDRKEFMKAIKFCAAKKPKVDYFIVYKIDRFARNQADHVTIRSLLKRYGTELISATEPINDSPIGKAMEGMLSVFAEFDNNVRAERTKSGMLARVQQGVWPWGAPFGYYRLVKKANLTPHPEAAPYVQLLFEEYAKGTHTYESLAKLLRERGIEKVLGKRLYQQQVERMLKNPLYAGVMEVWGKTYSGAFEPILSEELFMRCQDGYRSRSAHANPRTKENSLFPLRQLVACAVCAKPLTGSSSRNRIGKYYPYYHHQKQACKIARFYPKEEFENRFVKYLERITPNSRFLSFFRRVANDTWENNEVLRKSWRQTIQKDIEELKTERQKVFTLHRSGKYSDEEFEEQKIFLGRKIYEKTLLLDARDEHEDLAFEEAVEFAVGYISRTAKTWREMSYAAKVRFHKLVFPEKVVFDGDGFGTSRLSLIYQLFQGFDVQKSYWVPPTGQRWNQLLSELKGWLEFKHQLEELSSNKKPASEDAGDRELVS